MHIKYIRIHIQYLILKILLAIGLHYMQRRGI